MLTHTAKLEEYAAHALAKTAHSSASQLGKHLHETAQTKDHLDCWKWWLVESTKLDSELLVIAPTNQPSTTGGPTVTHLLTILKEALPERSLFQPHILMVMFTWRMSMTQWLMTCINKVVR